METTNMARQIRGAHPSLIRWARSVTAALVILPALLFVTVVLIGEPGPASRYVVPLVSSYVMQALDLTDTDIQRYSRFQIVKLADPSHDLMYWDPFLPADFMAAGPIKTPDFLSHITKIFVRDHFIIGQAESEYFILNADQSDLKFYEDTNQYNAALKNDRLSNILLIDPADMAAALPRQVIRPWAYQHMNNRWGHSDSWWSVLSVSTRCFACFVLGLVVPKVPNWIMRWILRGVLIAFAFVLGSHAADIANYNEPGPALFAGHIILPPMYAVAILWGIGTKNLIVTIRYRVPRKEGSRIDDGQQKAI